jgi:hypothetical protein
MRVTAVAALVGIALAGAVSLVADAAPGPGAERRAAAFARATCMAAMEDPAKVERIAKDRGWTQLADRSSEQPSFMTVIGTWRIAQDDRSYLVSIATSRNHGRPQNICTVVFESSELARAGFFAAMSDGWDLATITDIASPEWRNEMHTVRSARPLDLVLQMTSTPGGFVVSMTLLGTM